MYILKDAKFAEGVQGMITVHSPECEELQDICQEMCNWDRYGNLDNVTVF